MFCAKCGKKIDDDSTFCPYCGQKINAKTGAGKPSGAVSEKEPLSGDGKNNKVVIGAVAALIALIALVAVVFGAVRLLRGGKETVEEFSLPTGNIAEREAEAPAAADSAADVVSAAAADAAAVEAEEDIKAMYVVTEADLLEELRSLIGVANKAWSKILESKKNQAVMREDCTLSKLLQASSGSTDISFIKRSSSAICISSGFEGGYGDDDFSKFLAECYNGRYRSDGTFDGEIVNSNIQGEFRYYEGTDARIQLTFVIDEDDSYKIEMVCDKDDPSFWLIDSFESGSFYRVDQRILMDEDVDFGTDIDYMQVYQDYVSQRSDWELTGGLVVIDSNSDGIMEGVVPCKDGVRFLVAAADDVYVTEPFSELSTWDIGDSEYADNVNYPYYKISDKWNINGIWMRDGKILIEYETSVSSDVFNEDQFYKLSKRGSGLNMFILDWAVEELDLEHFNVSMKYVVIYSLDSGSTYFYANQDEYYLVKEDTCTYTDRTSYKKCINWLFWEGYIAYADGTIQNIPDYESADDLGMLVAGAAEDMPDKLESLLNLYQAEEYALKIN